MGGIQNNHVNMSLNKLCRPIQHIRGNTQSSTAKKSSLLILRRIGIFNLLLNIFDGNETL